MCLFPVIAVAAASFLLVACGTAIFQGITLIAGIRLRASTIELKVV